MEWLAALLPLSHDRHFLLRTSSLFILQCVFLNFTIKDHYIRIFETVHYSITVFFVLGGEIKIMASLSFGPRETRITPLRSSWEMIYFAMIFCMSSLFVCVRCDDHENVTSAAEGSGSDYERVTALAYFSVMAFPLLMFVCACCSCCWGALKNEYKPLDHYKETENQGLFHVTYPKMVLGFEMKRGLIVRVEPGTTSDGKLRYVTQ